MELDEVMTMIVKQEIDPEEFYSMVAKIKSVDETKRTCVVTPIEGESQKSNIRLQGAISGTDGIVQIPKVGSTVIVTFIDRTNGFIALATSITKLIIDADTLIQFNGGTEDGMVQINDLVTQMNLIESKVNDLVVHSATHVHAGVTSGGASTAIPTPVVSGALASTVKGDMENTNITQG